MYYLISFNCFYTNAHSFYNKFEEPSDIGIEKKTLVVDITETWLKTYIKDYDLKRCDSKLGIAGG